MLDSFCTKELITTFDVQVYSTTVRQLREAGLRFRTRTRSNRSSQRGGVLGSLGENMALSVEYQIFVAKNDLEEAVFLMQKGLHP